MTVTIKDVAKKANVAPSAVSRVIADNPSISEKTKRRVRKVMSELGYHPNLNARNLANQQNTWYAKFCKIKLFKIRFPRSYKRD